MSTTSASVLAKIDALINSGKSLSVKESVKLLTEAGVPVTHRTYAGYKDKKIAGARYVASRKEVKYWSVAIQIPGNVRTFCNETQSYASYSLTMAVLDILKSK